MKAMKRIVAVVAVVLVIIIGYSTVYRAGPHTWRGKTWGSKVHRCDLTVCLAAGRAVLDGADIYEAQNIRGWYYIYPPPFAILMVPFALLPVFWASLIWYILSVILIAGAVRFCVRMVRDAYRYDGDTFWLYVVPPFLVIWLLTSALQHGQTTPVLLWLVIAGLAYQARGRELFGGACPAGAILLKVTPVLLLAYFVWRKRWRFVAATVAAMAVGALVLPAAVYGWHGNLAHWHKWISRVAAPATQSESDRESAALYETLLNPNMSNNQSLQTVLWRLTGSPKARGVATGVLAVMAGVIVCVGWRRREDNELIILGAVIAWAALVPPVAWSHHFMVLLLPLTVLVFLAGHDPAPANRLLVRCALVVYAICFAAAAATPWRWRGMLCWGTMVLWAALIAVASRHARQLSTPGP